MQVPDLPPFYKMKWTDSDGKMTAESSLYSDELSQSLIQLVRLFNDYFGNGMPVPNKNTIEISELEPTASVGTIWFDTDVSKLKVKTASGIIETISSS